MESCCNTISSTYTTWNYLEGDLDMNKEDMKIMLKSQQGDMVLALL